MSRIISSFLCSNYLECLNFSYVCDVYMYNKKVCSIVVFKTKKEKKCWNIISKRFDILWRSKLQRVASHWLESLRISKGESWNIIKIEELSTENVIEPLRVLDGLVVKFCFCCWKKSVLKNVWNCVLQPHFLCLRQKIF